MNGRDTDPRLARLAVALAFVGGYVDAVGFVALARVFTGHITGNTVMLAIDVAEGTWAGIPQRLLAITMFIAGMVLGAVLTARIGRRGIRSRFAPAFVLQAMLLVPLMLGDGLLAHGAAHISRPTAWPVYAFTALAATALGLQNGTLRKVGRWVTHTTYISGAVTSLTEGVIDCWSQRGARPMDASSTEAPGAAPAGDGPADRARLTLLAGITFSFAAGALVGVSLYVSRGLGTLAVPVVLLLVMAVIDARRPLARWPLPETG